jgi:hypothetical protein
VGRIFSGELAALMSRFRREIYDVAVDDNLS